MHGQDVLLFSLVTLVGCGPQVEVPEPVVSFGTCGTGGPVPLLSREGLFPVYAQELGDDVQIWMAPPSWMASEMTEPEVWLVDSCGGNPRRISRGEVWADRIAGEWVTCDGAGVVGTGTIRRLDPATNAEPTVVFEDVFCDVVTTEYGWIARRADGMLLLATPSAEPEAPRELGVEADALPTECVAGALGGGCLSETLTFAGPSAYVVDRSGSLVEIHLDEGGATEVLADATWAGPTPDGTHLFWQASPASEGEYGAVYRRDTLTHEDVLAYVGPRPWFPEADTRRESAYALVRSSPPRLLNLETLEQHELPAGARSIGIRPGPRTVIFEDEQTYVWDDERSEAIPLGPTDATCPREWGSEGYDRVRCEDGGTQLWSTPYDGGDARHVATGITGVHFRHIAGQVVWSTDERAVVDRESASFFMVGELRLADGADNSVLLARDARLISGVKPELGGDVLYVTHHEGEVATLWRTSTD